MRQFLTPVLAFMLTTTLVVAAPYADYSLTDPDDTAPETVALADQETPLYWSDATPITPSSGDPETAPEDNTGELASTSTPDPDKKKPQTEGTSVTPSNAHRKNGVPDTPASGICSYGFYPLYSCSENKPLTRYYSTSGGIASTPLLPF